MYILNSVFKICSADQAFVKLNVDSYFLDLLMFLSVDRDSFFVPKIIEINNSRKIEVFSKVLVFKTNGLKVYIFNGKCNRCVLEKKIFGSVHGFNWCTFRIQASKAIKINL